MFAGHIGAGLALGRLDRRINVAWFVTAALLLDIALWILVLLGLESVTIPTDFRRTHQVAFSFPYSHGLTSAIVWSSAVAVCCLSVPRSHPEGRSRLALLLAAAVFSHWLLDALVHRPELPLLGNMSPRVGMSLWDHTALAVFAESLVVVAGLLIFVPTSLTTVPRTAALIGVVALTLALTVVGMTMSPPPPSAAAMAISSLVTLGVVVALVGWLTKARPSTVREATPNHSLQRTNPR